MNNITKLKNIYNYEKNHLFQDDILRKFALAYLNSNQQSEYKLYHQYIFRSDIAENHIKEHYSYKLKNSKFSWNNQNIKEQLIDWSHYFIGYTKFSNTDNFCELFLSMKFFDGKQYHCTGFCVNTHDPKYNYSFENTIELNYTNFDYPIYIDDDLGKHIKKFAASINN